MEFFELDSAAPSAADEKQQAREEREEEKRLEREQKTQQKEYERQMEKEARDRHRRELALAARASREASRAYRQHKAKEKRDRQRARARRRAHAARTKTFTSASNAPMWGGGDDEEVDTPQPVESKEQSVEEEDEENKETKEQPRQEEAEEEASTQERGDDNPPDPGDPGDDYDSSGDHREGEDAAGEGGIGREEERREEEDDDDEEDVPGGGMSMTEFGAVPLPGTESDFEKYLTPEQYKEEMAARRPDPECGGLPPCALCLVEAWHRTKDGSLTEAGKFAEWTRTTRKSVGFQHAVFLTQLYYKYRFHKFMPRKPCDLRGKPWALQTIADHFHFHDQSPESILSDDILTLTHLAYALKVNGTIVRNCATGAHHVDLKASKELRETIALRAATTMRLDNLRRTAAKDSHKSARSL
jgi:hypothetical protein